MTPNNLSFITCLPLSQLHKTCITHSTVIVLHVTYAKRITSTWMRCKCGGQHQCTFSWPGDRSSCELREYLERPDMAKALMISLQLTLPAAWQINVTLIILTNVLCHLSDTRSFCRRGTIDSIWKQATTCHSLFGWQTGMQMVGNLLWSS